MEISEDLRCVFSAEVEEQDGTYVVEVPATELELGTIRENGVYRVAVLAGATASEGETEPRDATDRGDVAADRSDDAGDDSRRGSTSGDDPRSTNGSGASAGEPEPPVDRGDEVTVDIEGIGDQGDGIARVDRGYVIIVPDTEKGERVRIQVTSVKQNVAFAEVVDRVERHQYE